jgi:hypothetical protein
MNAANDEVWRMIAQRDESGDRQCTFQSTSEDAFLVASENPSEKSSGRGHVVRRVAAKADADHLRLWSPAKIRTAYV